MMNNRRSPLQIIMNGLYTQPNLKWLEILEDNEIQPFVIQRILILNDNIRGLTRWLDKYVFPLQTKPKMYLALAWSIMPKSRNAPFFKYIKKNEKEDEYNFILKRVRKHFQLSDNDFRKNRDRIVAAIEKDKVSWFSFYGISKKHWKQHFLNFDKIKEFGVKAKPKTSGLDKWGFG